MAQVSVLLPVYNVAPYIAEALASIQTQTLTDIEIVVVDDGSTDETPRIVEQMALTDPRIKIVRTPRNLGLPAALNFGLPFCHAPLIARMDGDDVALPTRLEKQMRFLEENRGIALVGCATVAIDQSGSPIAELGISHKPTSDEEVTRTMLLASPCLHIWMTWSEVYRKLSGYRELSFAEDYDFLLRALSARYRISNIPEPLMKIRKRRGNLSSRIEQRKAHDYIVRLYRERLRHGQDSFSLENYRRAIAAGRVETSAYQLAIWCVKKGLQSSSRIVCGILMLASAVVSPWQARYFLGRIRFRLAMKRSMLRTQLSGANNSAHATPSRGA